MSEEGIAVRARRERLGMTIEALAREAQVSRDTLSDMESGTKDFRRLTLAKVQAALDRLEEEAGIHTPLAGTTEGTVPAPGLVRFTVRDVDGVEALTVEGPIDDIAELEEAVARIMRRLRKQDPNVD